MELSNRNFGQAACSSFTLLASFLSAHSLWPCLSSQRVGICPDDPSDFSRPCFYESGHLIKNDPASLQAIQTALGDRTDIVLRTYGEAQWAVWEHRGPYSELMLVWKQAFSAIEEDGKKCDLSVGPAYEIFLSEIFLNEMQNTRPEDLLTEVRIPIRD